MNYRCTKRHLFFAVLLLPSWLHVGNAPSWYERFGNALGTWYQRERANASLQFDLAKSALNSLALGTLMTAHGYCSYALAGSMSLGLLPTDTTLNLQTCNVALSGVGLWHLMDLIDRDSDIFLRLVAGRTTFADKLRAKPSELHARRYVHHIPTPEYIKLLHEYSVHNRKMCYALLAYRNPHVSIRRCAEKKAQFVITCHIDDYTHTLNRKNSPFLISLLTLHDPQSTQLHTKNATTAEDFTEGCHTLKEARNWLSAPVYKRLCSNLTRNVVCTYPNVTPHVVDTNTPFLEPYLQAYLSHRQTRPDLRKWLVGKTTASCAQQHGATIARHAHIRYLLGGTVRGTTRKTLLPHELAAHITSYLAIAD